MSYFDQLGKCSFDGIQFPVESVSITGGIRRYNHEFPHTPGAKKEKLGRKEYTVRIAAHFHDVLNLLYPGLYPDGLEKLFRVWEAQKTSALILPTLGKIDACCVNWSKHMVAQIRSGERVELEFEEDQSSAFLLDALLGAAATALAATNVNFQMYADQLDPKPGIFEQINDAIDKVRMVRDAADVSSNLLEAKLLQVAQLCDEATRTNEQLQDPVNHKLLEALKEVWASAQANVDDLLGQRSPIRTFTTPTRMSITDISLRIYGRTDKSMELLQINAVDDAFDIGPGVTLKYYEEAA